MSLIQELKIKKIDEIVQLLEARLPTNPRNPENKKLERSLEKSLSDYFKDLESVLPLKKIEKYIEEVIPKEVKEVLEPIIIQGIEGKKGETGDKGDIGSQGEIGFTGDTGEKGRDGLKGDVGIRGERGDRGIQGSQGKKGKDGRDGLKGEKGERGEKGDKGEPSLTEDQISALSGTVGDPSSENKFVTDEDKRLKDKREPLEHKHPEIQPYIISYPVVSGVIGVGSEPPEDFRKVTNIYIEPITGRLIVIHEL